MNKFEILAVAAQTLHDRAETYGADPLPLFTTAADLWSAYKGVPFTPVDVARMMELLKMARDIHAPEHADSCVDRIGYAALAGDLAGRR